MSGFVLLQGADGQYRLEPSQRPPRFRYFQKRNGPMFSWSVERMEGVFASWVHVPTGKGSRSGRAREWTFADDSLALHELRRDAKARAWSLFQAWLDGEAKPW